MKGVILMYEIIQNDSNDLTRQPDLFDLYTRFINYIDVSENTVKTYSRALKQFFKYLASEGIAQPQRSDILAYKQQLADAGRKASTIQGYIIAVRQFFKWTEQEGLYPNVANNVKGAKISKSHKKDYLTTKQIQTVLNTIPTDTVKGIRDYAILALMVTGGLRTIEVSRANIEDMRTVGDSTALFIQGKGKDDKNDYIKLSDEVETAIRMYLQTRPTAQPTDPLFASTSNNNLNKPLTTRSISGVVKQALRDAGFNSDRLTAHSLRHSAGTLNLLNGGTLEETQQLLRHSNINTTMIYLHHLERENNKSEERISNAIFKNRKG